MLCIFSFFFLVRHTITKSNDFWFGWILFCSSFFSVGAAITSSHHPLHNLFENTMWTNWQWFTVHWSFIWIGPIMNRAEWAFNGRISWILQNFRSNFYGQNMNRWLDKRVTFWNWIFLYFSWRTHTHSHTYSKRRHRYMMKTGHTLSHMHIDIRLESLTDCICAVLALCIRKKKTFCTHAYTVFVVCCYFQCKILFLSLFLFHTFSSPWRTFLLLLLILFSVDFKNKSSALDLVIFVSITTVGIPMSTERAKKKLFFFSFARSNKIRYQFSNDMIIIYFMVFFYSKIDNKCDFFFYKFSYWWISQTHKKWMLLSNYQMVECPHRKFEIEIVLFFLNILLLFINLHIFHIWGMNFFL